MRKARIGPLQVSPIGLGLWQLGSPSWGTSGLSSAVGLIREAVERGFNLFDTAEVYGWGRSEELLGKALKELNVGDEVVVASKIGGFRTTPYTIRRAAEGSWRRLGRVPDIIQYHWPPPYHTPLCMAMRGLETLIARGLTHYVGLSNFNSSLLEKALSCFKRYEPVSIQIQYNLAYRTPEGNLIPLARKTGLSVIAWSPLAKGALAGASRAATRAQRTDKVFSAASRDGGLREAIRRVAEKHGSTMAQVSLAWLIARGAIPIPGTRRVDRVVEYSGVFSLTLDEDDVKVLDDASSRYISMWGSDYSLLQWLRLIPSPIQYLFIRIGGGI